MGLRSSSIGLGFVTQERVVGGAGMCREFPAHTQDGEKRFDGEINLCMKAWDVTYCN